MLTSRTFIAALFVTLLAGASYAADDLTTNTTTFEGYVLKDGGILAHHEGKVTEVNTETTFPDGSRLLPGGTLLLRDGTSRKLGNGDRLTLEGKIIEQSTKPAPEVPDSRVIHSKENTLINNTNNSRDSVQDTRGLQKGNTTPSTNPNDNSRDSKQ